MSIKPSLIGYPLTKVIFKMPILMCTVQATNKEEQLKVKYYSK